VITARAKNITRSPKRLKNHFTAFLVSRFILFPPLEIVVEYFEIYKLLCPASYAVRDFSPFRRTALILSNYCQISSRNNDFPWYILNVILNVMKNLVLLLFFSGFFTWFEKLTTSRLRMTLKSLFVWTLNDFLVKYEYAKEIK